MNWHVIVSAGISQAIGRCGLSRQGLVRVLVAVHVKLSAIANALRPHRDPIDQDFFLYHFALWDSGAFHTLEFRVNDVSAPGFLFIVRLKHTV
ncbi:MAG TPA: hypothetical protein DDY78_09590 [Planctomycetales bacterium]|jgi:hypothetical protein|nr:hypothetical protein [Planctomycetales bacterium]